MGWEGHVVRFGFEGNCIHGLGENPEGHRNDLEDTRVQQEGNNKMDPRKICWKGMDWIPLSPDRYRWRYVAKAVMNIRAS